MQLVVYGISRWTNPRRASARHLANDRGKPLCGSKRRVLSWEFEEGMPTCNKCIRENTVNFKITFRESKV